MFEAWKSRAEPVSTEVHRFATKPEALAFIASLLRAEGVSETAGAVWADGDGLVAGPAREALRREVPGLSFEVTRERAAAAKVGLSRMDMAVADTGSLVRDATRAEDRMAAALPRVHVAIAPTRRIVPDLAALLRAMPPQEHPYLAFTTGPSRTADIERVLTIGVHGPERLVAVFIDELQDDVQHEL